jgi:hypothetical protein
MIVFRNFFSISIHHFTKKVLLNALVKGFDNPAGKLKRIVCFPRPSATQFSIGAICRLPLYSGKN